MLILNFTVRHTPSICTDWHWQTPWHTQLGVACNDSRRWAENPPLCTEYVYVGTEFCDMARVRIIHIIFPYNMGCIWRWARFHESSIRKCFSLVGDLEMLIKQGICSTYIGGVHTHTTVLVLLFRNRKQLHACYVISQMILFHDFIKASEISAHYYVGWQRFSSCK